MIERKFVDEHKKEFLVEEFIRENLKGVGHSKTQVRKTPLGEKIIIFSSRPGLVVGRAGANIKKLTKLLKTRFNFENPQIEIAEVENVNLDPQIVAEKIANSLEKFGVNKFKGIMHKAMTDTINSGAKGVEIRLAGKLPSARAKIWKVYAGYLKRCGDPAVSGIKLAKMQALLKTGIIGIQVRIMPPDLKLPDKVVIYDSIQEDQVPKIVPKEETKQEKAPRKPRAKKQKETAKEAVKEPENAPAEAKDEINKE